MKKRNIILLLAVFSFSKLVSAGTGSVLGKISSIESFNSSFPYLQANKLFPFPEQTDLDDYYKVIAPTPIDFQLVEPELRLSGLISNIEKETAFNLSVVHPKKGFDPEDFFNYQWALENHGQDIEYRYTDEFFETLRGKKGSDVDFKFLSERIDPLLRSRPLVAVLDSGVDISHQDLEGRIYKNQTACEDRANSISPKPPAPTKENPFPWDCSGYNFAAFLDNDIPEVMDVNGHGTHISGIMAANANDFGVKGISQKIDILPVKVYLDLTEYPDARSLGMNYHIRSLTSNVARGLYYAIYKNVDVINMSLGWPPLLDSPLILQLIEIAREKNIAIVTAAGNDNSFSQVKPCAYENVICVGASNNQGKVAKYSNIGAHVDFFAPGSTILSTFPNNKSVVFTTQKYEYMTGSSQASPYIAGLVAMAKAYFPDKSIREIKERMFASSQSAYPHGNSFYPQAKLLFSTKELGLVYPEFKNTGNALFDSNSIAKISYKLKSNMDFEFDDIKIQISDMKKHFQFVSNSCEKQNSKTYSCYLKISANIEAAEHFLEFSLKLNSEKFLTKDLRVKLHAALEFIPEASKEIRTIGLNFEEANKYKNSDPLDQLAFLHDRSFQFVLRAPTPSLKYLQTSNYYYSENNKYFFYDVATAEVQFQGELADNQELFEVYAGDFNYDHKEDYLLLVGSFQTSEKKVASGLYYYYLDANGKPLYKNNKFKIKDLNFGINSSNFMSMQWRKIDNNGQPMSVPVFWGLRSKFKDLSLPKVYGKQTNSQQAIFSFKLEKINDELNLSPTLFDNRKFYKEMKEKVLSHIGDEFLISSSFSQGEDDFYAGKISLLALHGTGLLSNSMLLILDSDFSYKAEKLSQNIVSRIGARTNPVFKQDSNNIDSHVLFFSTEYKNSLAVLNKKQLSWDSSVYSVVPGSPSLGTILSYSKSSENLKHLTFNNLNLYLRDKSDKDYLDKKQLLKNTLIPFVSLKQSYFPMYRGFKTNKQFMIFVEESYVEGSQTHFLSISGNRLESKLKHKLMVPGNCNMENSAYSKQSGEIAVVLLCTEKQPDSDHLSQSIKWMWLK